MHSQYSNLITPTERDFLESLHRNGHHINSYGMDKVLLPHDNELFTTLINDILSIRLGLTNYEICGDNFYQHSVSYFAHCDARENTAWKNIVIPLRINRAYGAQKFVVFDQTYSLGNATWIGSYAMEGDFYSNKKIALPFSASPGFGLCSDAPISEELYSELDQKYYTREYCSGLTGHAYPVIPGTVIVFDSQHIHCTGRMNCASKLGLSIRIKHQ